VGVSVALASVDLRDPIFISDLHLTQDQPRTVQRFMHLAQAIAPKHRELVILGDLFEYWAGDEEATEGIGAVVSGALRSLARAGTAVYLMQGNRDVLLGDGFAQASGAAFLADPCRAVLAGQPTLLAHGDAYCTLDTTYQAFRRRARNRLWQRLFLGAPLGVRRALIGQLRRFSEAEKKRMAAQIMDVTPEAIEQALRSGGVRRMIHGHTHRPDRHHLTVDGQAAERWVLPDWDLDGDPKRAGYLQVSGNELAVVDLASELS
jgi:UDP-2,3-diacylglucosamine hydrolase